MSFNRLVFFTEWSNGRLPVEDVKTDFDEEQSVYNKKQQNKRKKSRITDHKYFCIAGVLKCKVFSICRYVFVKYFFHISNVILCSRRLLPSCPLSVLQIENSPLDFLYHLNTVVVDDYP